MTSWSEDANITTSLYEDQIHSGEGIYFNTILKVFNTIEYKFNEIGPVVTKTEDSDTSASWSEDAYISTTLTEDAYISTTLSED